MRTLKVELSLSKVHSIALMSNDVYSLGNVFIGEEKLLLDCSVFDNG